MTQPLLCTLLVACLLFFHVHCTLALTGVLPFVTTINTPPDNGDVNPYGIVFIPSGFCSKTLTSSNILIANFNNATNLQGTGTTISLLDSSNPSPTAGTFFNSPNNIGLITLNILTAGYILVGNVPFNTTSMNIGLGVIQVLDCNANVVATLGSSLSVTHPWGTSVYESSSTVYLFVSNVLEGNVVRITLGSPSSPSFTNAQATVIATGYTTAPSASAFVVGPTGSAYNASTDTLYVASSGDNQIYAIPSATTRTSAVTKGNLVYSDPVHLHGPQGLVFTPQGNLLTANADSANLNASFPSLLTEFTTTGTYVSSLSIDQNNGGSFQLAYGSVPSLDVTGVLAAVDDNANQLQLYMLASSLTTTTGSSASTLASPFAYLIPFFQ